MVVKPETEHVLCVMCDEDETGFEVVVGEIRSGIRAEQGANSVRSHIPLWLGSVRDDRMASVNGMNHVGNGIEAKELMVVSVQSVKGQGEVLCSAAVDTLI